MSTLEYALASAGLLDYFAKYPLGVTVLAPTNEAFAELEKIDPVFYSAILTKDWLYHLQHLLLNHVFEAEIKSSGKSG